MKVFGAHWKWIFFFVIIDKKTFHKKVRILEIDVHSGLKNNFMHILYAE